MEFEYNGKRLTKCNGYQYFLISRDYKDLAKASPSRDRKIEVFESGRLKNNNVNLAYVSMAQWIRRPPPKGKITGSTPVRDTLP